MAQRIQLRRGTAAEWTAENPVLANGEPGVEKDTGKLKLGDGVTAWTALPYASKGDQGIPGVADDASVKTLITTPGSQTAGALNATYVPQWKPATAYTAGQAVVNPSGDVVTSKADHTSGASFTAANWNLSASYAPTSRVAKAPVATSTGIYDQRLNIYNFKPAQVFRLRAALARAKTGAALASVGFVGDSTVAGTNGGNTPGVTDWPTVFKNALVSAGYPSAGTGFVAAYRGSNGSDPRWTYGAGWVAPGLGNIMSNNSTSNPMTFTSTEPGTEVRVYRSRNGGHFTVSIDGGAPVQVNADGVGLMSAYTVTGLPNTTHTISIVRTGVNAEIAGVEVLNSSTTGVRYHNAGIAGSKVATLADTDFRCVSNMVAGAAPRLVANAIFIMCETNDVSGAGGTPTPVATYKSQMQTAINNLKVNSANLVLVTAVPTDPLDFTEYTKALYELADTNDLPLIDLQQRWVSFAEANARGIMGDGSHPAPSGNADIGTSIPRALGLV